MKLFKVKYFIRRVVDKVKYGGRVKPLKSKKVPKGSPSHIMNILKHK